MEEDLTKCGRCGADVEPELHDCPYRADVYNDPTPCCNCCERCAQNCADDI